MPQQRALLALVGALAGASLYLLLRIAAEGIIGDTAAAVLMVFAGVFFSSVLVLSGPMELPRAAPRAALQAAGIALLVLWASTRFDRVDSLFASPLVIAATLVLALIPLPFVLAEDRTTWRDYQGLFTAAWGIVMRTIVAWGFVALLWGVIWLCHVLLSVVGIDLIARIVLVPAVPWLVTGTAFGLAMAVALELREVVAPSLALRLMRLLLPVVLAVTVIFLLAVAVRGPGALSGFSSAGILLVMAAVSATLVTSVIDRSDAEATHSRFLLGATQALAALLVLTAALAAWALSLRVFAHGWTPGRLFAASVNVLALGYGLTYLLAILRRRRWMDRIRQANIGMALVLMGLAVLWLTPVLNPERISAASQIARLVSGRTMPEAFDLAALDRWGRAGATARAQVEAMAKTDPALARLLAAEGKSAPVAPEDPEVLRQSLSQRLPVQPASESGFRDRMLELAAPDDLQVWTDACAATIPSGGPGCVLVVADFIPDLPGPESILVLNAASGYVSYLGLAIDGDALRILEVDSGTGAFANFDDGANLIGALQAGLPDLRPVPRNELDMPIGGPLGLKP